MDISEIRESMGVIAADGRQIGFVSGLQSVDELRLTRMKGGHGFDHVIPLAWISAVDRYVFLSRGSAYVAANWKTAPQAPRERAKAA